MSELVQIRMLTRGPNKNHQPKRIRVVDATRAQLLMAGKHAEPARKEVADANNEGV